MIRLRKYRVFLFVTALCLGIVYWYGKGKELGPSLEEWREYGSKLTANAPKFLQKDSIKPVWEAAAGAKDKLQVQLQDKIQKFASTTSTASRLDSTASSASTLTATGRSTTSKLAAASTKLASKPDEGEPVETSAVHLEAIAHENALYGAGRLDMAEIEQNKVPHWTKPTAHFFIPTESIIPLPNGKPKTIPRIQARFSAESSAERADREDKLKQIKMAFNRTWSAYREHAWMHDELKPVAAGFVVGSAGVRSWRDPFGGWAATLVDSLDTLWIMGMKNEFEEAVNATAKIDFTTCTRMDIPVFETTIRYLGGLLGAYDVSGGNYPLLLQKAVELAEVLMGAFDTPNHMPMMFYPWMPDQMAVPKRAGTRVVLAEFGSLLLEFTRLAQLTKEDKYYDAVARITNELEEFQNRTSLPGMWPEILDISGCENIVYNSSRGKPQLDPFSRNMRGSKTLVYPVDLEKEATTLKLVAMSGITDLVNQTLEEKYLEKDSSTFGQDIAGSQNIAEQLFPEKDSSSFGNSGPITTPQSAEEVYPKKDSSSFGDSTFAKRSEPSTDGMYNKWAPAGATCEGSGQALRESKQVWKSKYTLGGGADSTYEYLTKEYLLLGGLNEQYRSLYTTTLKTVEDYLLYSPLVEPGNDLLFTGSYTPVNHNNETGRENGWFEAQTGHLSCFVGGFYALGAKVFDRPDDMSTAAKLTDGCVWSYASTVTGIGPEDFIPTVCKDPKSRCAWNETEWMEQIVEKAGGLGTALWSRLTRLEKQLNPEPTKSNTKSSGEVTPFSEINESPADPRQLLVETVQKGGAPPLIPAPDTASADATDLIGLNANTNAKTNVNGKRQLVDLAADSKLETTDTATSTTDPDNHGYTDPGYTILLEEFNNRKPLPPGPETQNAGQQTPPGTPTIPSPPNQADQELDPLAAGFRDLLAAQAATPKANPSSRADVIRDYIHDQSLTPGLLAIPSRKYILRPETIESIFYLYRTTASPIWRQKGWEMFQAIETYTRTDLAYSAIDDVTNSDPRHLDEMESFWTAETLKYFWLLYSEEDVVGLDDWVFNTEAHPFLRPDAGGDARARNRREILLPSEEELKTRRNGRLPG